MATLKDVNITLLVVFIILAILIIRKAKEKDKNELINCAEKDAECKKHDTHTNIKIEHMIHKKMSPPGRNTEKIISSACDSMIRGGLSGCLIGGVPGGVATGMISGIASLVHSGKSVYI